MTTTIKINPAAVHWTTAVATALREQANPDVWVEFTDDVEPNYSVEQVIEAANAVGEDPQQFLDLHDFFDLFVRATVADLRRNSTMPKMRQARETIDRTAAIMRGIEIVQKNEKMVDQMLEHATFNDCGMFRFLKCVDQTKPSKWMEGQLQDRGIDGFVFSREGRQPHSHTLGIIAINKSIDLTPLVEVLPGWVVDNGIALWGTYENPKLCLPPEGPQDTDDLIDVLQELLQDGEQAQVVDATRPKRPPVIVLPAKPSVVHAFKDYEEYED